MFRRPVQRCAAGDRVGVCVTQLDPKLVERGVACAPGSVPTFSGAIAAVGKIRFFQGARAVPIPTLKECACSGLWSPASCSGDRCWAAGARSLQHDLNSATCCQCELRHSVF